MDPNQDQTMPRRDLLLAVFTDPFTDSLLARPTDTTRPIADIILDTIARKIGASTFHGRVESSGHFFWVLQSVLNAAARQQIHQNLQDYDRLVGLPAAEAFIRGKTFEGWLRDLVLEVLVEARREREGADTADASAEASGGQGGFMPSLGATIANARDSERADGVVGGDDAGEQRRESRSLRAQDGKRRFRTGLGLRRKASRFFCRKPCEAEKSS